MLMLHSSLLYSPLPRSPPPSPLTLLSTLLSLANSPPSPPTLLSTLLSSPSLSSFQSSYPLVYLSSRLSSSLTLLLVLLPSSILSSSPLPLSISLSLFSSPSYPLCYVFSYPLPPHTLRGFYYYPARPLSRVLSLFV